MRWSCPHCGINLAISDDKLGPGWSFSRCYKCGGFALVRRAEVNLIKVDRAPAGENVILPEATESPYEMLSEQATQNLASLRRDSAERAATRQPHPTPAAQPAAHAMYAPQAQTMMPPQMSHPMAPPPMNGTDPLVAAYGASESTVELHAPTATTTRRSLLRSGIELSKRLLPGAIAVAAITATGSGIYLFLQGQALWENARIEMKNARAERAEARAAASESTIVQTSAAQPIQPSSDQLRVNAMAPARTDEASTAKLTVRAREKNADLHSGPGSLYPIVGYANPQSSLQVLDWSDRWFKISLAGVSGAKPGQEYAWIRTDLVQVLSQPPAPAAAASSQP